MNGNLDDGVELDELGPLLAGSLDPVQPPPSVKRAVMAAICAPGRVIRANEGKWYRQPPDGITVKPLAVDEARGLVTLLMKFEAGAVYPPHDHHGAEQSFVVTGSCRIGELRLFAGDFHRADAGSQHDAVISDDGCTLLLVIDRHDYVAA
jgi:anti-sigma factor ChrR (cupin superfamily)